MKRSLLAFVLVLTACGSADVRDTKIADIDFTDAAQVQAIAQGLDAPERKAFQSYVIGRTIGMNQEVVRPDGNAPETVREAITLTTKRNRLSEERNALVERHNALYVPGEGVPDKDQAEWDRLEKEIADYDDKLKQFR